LFGGAAVGNLGLLLFYYCGQLDDHIVARLVLPFNVVLALAIAWSVERFPTDWRPVMGRWLSVGALVSYLGFGMPTLAYHRTLNQQAWEMAWEQQWVATRPAVSRLIITNKSAMGSEKPRPSTSHVRGILRNRCGFIRKPARFRRCL
jgi:hypothetical protein